MSRVVELLPWMEELLKRDSFSATEAGKAAKCCGADAITRLRMCRKVMVEVIGHDGSAYKRKIYRLRRSNAATGN